MKSQAYSRGEREYSLYGLDNTHNPFPSDTQDYEDYSAGKIQAHRRNPDLGARLKQDADEERLLAFQEQQAEEVKAEALRKKKIANFKRMKDGY
jgi:hypothetical protein